LKITETKKLKFRNMFNLRLTKIVTNKVSEHIGLPPIYKKTYDSIMFLLKLKLKQR